MIETNLFLFITKEPLFKRLTLVIVVLLFLGKLTAQVDEWKPASGPMKTRWTKDVSPANAMPEYPRPQMVRKEWLSLNGLWKIKLGDSTETRILVPYPVESALSGVMKHFDRLTYRRSFEIPGSWRGKNVLLHFGAVDWETKVSLNGKELGIHRGGYDAFSFDVTAALKTEGPQEITVEVFDPTDQGGQPRGKQKLKPGGIMYTPTTGIWQTVWLEPVSVSHIKSLKIVPDIDGGCLRLTVEGSGKVDVLVSDGGKKIIRESGDAGTELKLAVPNPKLWSPDSPYLYDLQVSLKDKGKVVDEVTSYFGMRKIAIGKDEKGVTRIMLNGKYVFQVGPLDQGFWPDGLYTAPTDEAMRWDVAKTKRLGFNTIRKHVKIEPDRWYYWCDKLGLPIEGHTWSKRTWGYQGTKNIEDLTLGYEKLLKRAWELNDSAGLSAVIYTQLTDIETECKGLLTYDREINKVIPGSAAAANSGKQTNVEVSTAIKGKLVRLHFGGVDLSLLENNVSVRAIVASAHAPKASDSLYVELPIH
jgi:hypothetical protein